MSDAVLATLAPPFTPRPDYWRRWRESSALPGFKLAFGFTLFYVGLVILLPLAALVARPWEHGVSGFVDAISGPRTLAALRLSFFGAAFAALANVVLGVAVAWVLTRYEFPGRSVLDALVDLPFALPTAVAGVAPIQPLGP
jgi:sulfate transport system permease protein